ncbi:MAG: hypothetical protein J6Q78_00970 [Clostridia bacterium]|nr:hypothetical protein [Clostridia bacterium]
MEKTKRNFNIYVIGSIAATLICVLLRTLCVFLFYDLEIGYYTRGAALPIIFNILIILSVVFFGVGALLLTKDKGIDVQNNSQFVRYLSIVPFGAFLFFVANASNKLLAYSSLNAQLDMTFYISLICGLCGAIYFAMTALNKNKAVVGLLFGFLTIVWFIVSLATSYFDPYVQMNSPDKLIFHMACLSGMLFILGEIRCYFSTPRKTLYMFSLSLASLFLFTTSVPSILVTLFGDGLRGYVLLAEDVVCFAVGLFATAKLISIAFFEEEEIKEKTEEENETTGDTAQEIETVETAEEKVDEVEVSDER